jgi:hypothetical protein
MGAATTDRATIRRAIEELRDEVSHVGRLLAGSLSFAYPEALEETVRRCWQEYVDSLEPERED